MAKSNANNPVVIACKLGTVSTAGDYPLCYLPKKFVLLDVHVMDQAGVAADNTNYITLTVKQSATTLATYDSRAANQGTLTANVAKAAALAADEAEITGSVKVTYAEGGTGTTTDAVVQLYGYFK